MTTRESAEKLWSDLTSPPGMPGMILRSIQFVATADGCPPEQMTATMTEADRWNVTIVLRDPQGGSSEWVGDTAARAFGAACDYWFYGCTLTLQSVTMEAAP
jgi:hypothetical protein